MSEWSPERMAQLGARHSLLEARGELEPLLETLVESPVYEFHPIGLAMRGGDTVRRFYTQFCERFLPLRHSYTLLDEWVNERSVAQEYDVSLRVDGQVETHRVLGVLYADPAVGLLAGERVYAPERFIRLMTGELFDELKPL
jgi:hypothetical protein